jgi:hypothetical protein
MVIVFCVFVALVVVLFPGVMNGAPAEPREYADGAPGQMDELLLIVVILAFAGFWLGAANQHVLP